MIIRKRNYPNIGSIRGKKLPGKEPRWELSIYPPGGYGPLQGHEPASWVEVEVSQEEAERIERVAPHLLSGVTEASASDRYRFGLPARKRAGKAKEASRAQSSS